MANGSRQSQGWGMATFIIVLAIVVNAGVTWFHYRHANQSPNDVTFHPASRAER